ncbi:MAG: hypothetical protein OQK94_00970 [Gammaproteobacteria bacterium]|nr:hypothetical protein [Gammaproteobacteria bacterium]MCW8839874.1 hypothetical protein [Gammaproteobacteria bacterium]MCW8958916.1 hypothetical protein [Gammaproteobacteria bacterium]MCW8992410.1 hypothetical protein [Gammaproteobacteria bacterium]
MSNKHEEGKSKKVYTEEELIERLTPYLAHADELEGLTLSKEEFEWMLEKVENPPETSPKLKKLMKRKAPWE